MTNTELRHIFADEIVALLDLEIGHTLKLIPTLPVDTLDAEVQERMASGEYDDLPGGITADNLRDLAPLYADLMQTIRRWGKPNNEAP